MCEHNQFGGRSASRCLTGSRAPPTRQVLQGSRCRLEPLTLAHASDLFAAHQLAPDARSWTWLLREPESNLENSVLGGAGRHAGRPDSFCRR